MKMRILKNGKHLENRPSKLKAQFFCQKVFPDLDILEKLANFKFLLTFIPKKIAIRIIVVFDKKWTMLTQWERLIRRVDSK